MNGFIVPPEDPDAMADAINRFLDLPVHEAYKMGEMSRLLAERVYGWDRIAERTAGFYETVLGR